MTGPVTHCLLTQLSSAFIWAGYTLWVLIARDYLLSVPASGLALAQDLIPPI